MGGRYKHVHYKGVHLRGVSTYEECPLTRAVHLRGVSTYEGYTLGGVLLVNVFLIGRRISIVR